MRWCTFETEGRLAPGRIEAERVIELGAPSLADWLEAGGEDVAEHPLEAVRLRAPIPRPPSVRDFYAFEQHVATARASRGLEVPPEWYGRPVFYFSNPAAIYGPGDEISFPAESSEWDYELEVAAVIGPDRRLHDPQRLVCARPPAGGDDRRSRSGEGEGLRDLARAGAGHPGRARRPSSRDDRPRERRGALPG